MIYLLKNDIKFLKIREEKIIPIMSLVNVKKIHISSVNVGDLIFDDNGNIATITEVMPEKTCKIIVLSINSNKNDNTITSFR